MAAGDVTTTRFSAQDDANAEIQIKALNIATGDLVLHWQQNNEVIVARIEPN